MERPAARFACGSCGDCCNQPWRTQIEADKAAALDQHDWSKYPQLRGRRFYHAPADNRPGYLGSDDALAEFAGMVTYLDKLIGQVLERLKKLGIADNTIVFFCSDNGPQPGVRRADRQGQASR